MNTQPLFPALLLGIFCCTQCSNPTPPPVETAAVEKIVTLKGSLVFDDQSSQFKECGTDKTYRVIDGSGALDTLYAQACAPFTYPGERVYAVLTGKIRPASESGNSALYAGVFSISKADTVEVQNSFNICEPYDFWCSGTEPFWDARISKNGETIIYQDISLEQVLVFSNGIKTQKGEGWVYKAKESATGRTIEISIKKGECSDGMSDQIFPYASTLVFGREKREGCAVAPRN